MARSTAAAPEIVETPSSAIARSPSDVLRAGVAACSLSGLLLLQWASGDTLLRFSRDLLRGSDALPSWIVYFVVVGTRLLACVLLGGGLALALRRGRWRLLARIVASGAIAVLFAVLGDAVTERPQPPVVALSGALGALDHGHFPTVSGLAVITAGVTAAAPWISRRWRRSGWVLVVGLVVARLVSAPVAFDSVRGAVAGWLAGAMTLVILGGPSRKPAGIHVASGLADIGLPLARLEQASLDARGSTPYFGRGLDGSKLFVKVLGVDERSADLMFRIYRGVRPRHLGDERPFSSLRRAVEHEALVSLAATSFGVRTPAVVGVATVDPSGFVVVYEAIDGRSLDRVDDDEVTDEVLTSIWDQISILRRHRIAHRDLRLANIFLASTGEVWMIDFGFSELAASDLLLANDLAELLTSTSLQVGPERAVAIARQALGPDQLGPAGDRLHRWALSGATGAALKEHPDLLAKLRSLVGATMAGNPPEPSVM